VIHINRVSDDELPEHYLRTPAPARPAGYELAAAKLRVELDESLGRPTPPALRYAARLYDDPTLPWPPPAAELAEGDTDGRR
jgi:hypothetical protein